MTRIAGQPRTQPEVLHVDYADVLAQAVENERWRIIREVERAAQNIPTTKPSVSRSYGTDDISAATYKRALLDRLDEIGRAAR